MLLEENIADYLWGRQETESTVYKGEIPRNWTESKWKANAHQNKTLIKQQTGRK